MTELRYGIIGTGMMGVEHILNINAVDGARVTAIADPVAESRRWGTDAAGRPPGLVVFEDHRDLLASDTCDAVVVATPNMTHAEILHDVFETDLPVLVEKPLCTTVEDCRRVIDAAEDRAALVWVGLEYRYMPPIARLTGEVHAGAVGDVRMVAIREHRFPFLPKVGNWNRFNANTGGTLVEKCCHFFDLMNHIARARPVRVLASGGHDVNHLDESYDGATPDILDNAYVIVEYDAGVRAMLDLCMFAEASVNREEVGVVGDAGKIEAFLPDSTVRIGRRDAGPSGIVTETVHDDRIRYQGFHHGSSYLEHLDFLAAVRGERAPEVDVGDGLWSVAVGAAAQQSIEAGTVVDLDDVV